MKSHYKSESEEEKRTRLEEKQRRRGNRRGPARAAMGPMVVAARPLQVRVRQPKLKTLARNVSRPVEGENVEVREMEMEDVQGNGSAPGITEIKEEPVM